MADHTHIEWTDATWNVVTGCSVVSPGCTNCYAMKLAGTRLQHHPTRAGLTTPSKAGPVWNGQVRFNVGWLDQPLRWTKPHSIFVAAHGDLFHEGVTDDQLDRIFAVMALCPQHTFQVLTKRPERMRVYLSRPDHAQQAMRELPTVLPMPLYTGFEQKSVLLSRQRAIRARWSDANTALTTGPLPNVWLGVSAEDQTRADWRIPVLLDTPAAVRWVSAEPLLGPLDLRRWMPAKRQAYRPGGEPFLAPHFYMTKCEHCGWVGSSELCGSDSDGDDSDVYCARCSRSILGDDGGPSLDWVVVGGESGPDARPMHPDWARNLRDQCAAAGVPFLFKQWGEWTPGENAQNTLGRAVDTADWFDGRWDFQRLSAGDCEGRHIDDEPTLYRAGKRAAGRRLDGVIHDGYPEARS